MKGLTRKVQVIIPSWVDAYLMEEAKSQGITYSDQIRYFIYRGVVSHITEAFPPFEPEVVKGKKVKVIDHKAIEDLSYEARRAIIHQMKKEAP